MEVRIAIFSLIVICGLFIAAYSFVEFDSISNFSIQACIKFIIFLDFGLDLFLIGIIGLLRTIRKFND